MHIVSEKKLGIPQNSRDAFDLLYQGEIINGELLRKMKAMIGFENLAVHNYQIIDLNVVKTIIEKHLQDLLSFAEVILTSNK